MVTLRCSCWGEQYCTTCTDHLIYCTAKHVLKVPDISYQLVYLQEIWLLLCPGNKSIQNYTDLDTLFRCFFYSGHRAVHEKAMWKVFLERLSGAFYQWRKIKKPLGAILSSHTALDYRWLVLLLPRTPPATLVGSVLVPAVHDLVPQATDVM